MNKRAKVGLTVGTAVVVLGGAIGYATCTAKVGVSEIGIKYSLNGGLQEEVLQQGLNFKMPWEKVTTYPTSLNTSYLSKDKQEGSKDDDSFDITSKDAKVLKASMSYQYRFNEENIVNTYNQFKGASAEAIENKIRGMVKSAVNDVTNRYEAMTLMGGHREEINKALTDHFKTIFGEYGIDIVAVNLIEVLPDEATQQMVQQKVNKQQEIEIARLEAEKQALDVERELAKAKAEAEKEKVKAEAQAQAELIKAQAQAEANRLLSESITDQLIELEQIGKWNGEYPQVMGGNTPILDLR